jgi:hypothetical protein
MYLNSKNRKSVFLLVWNSETKMFLDSKEQTVELGCHHSYGKWSQGVNIIVKQWLEPGC